MNTTLWSDNCTVLLQNHTHISVTMLVVYAIMEIVLDLAFNQTTPTKWPAIELIEQVTCLKKRVVNAYVPHAILY